MKSWCNSHRRLILVSLQIWFLRNCIDYDLIPRHIDNLCKRSPSFFTRLTSSKHRHLRNVYIFLTLRYELQDAYRLYEFLKREIAFTDKRLSNLIPLSIFDNFCEYQYSFFSKLWLSQYKRLNSKLIWLELRKERGSINIKPIITVLSFRGMMFAMVSCLTIIILSKKFFLRNLFHTLILNLLIFTLIQKISTQKILEKSF